jgi:3-oxoacyl-[acyl-carrier protein] reductase
MAERGWGRVINVSSISGRLGTAGMTAYCASKWGLNGFTQALAAELRPSNVLVAAVLPGSVDTEMLAGSGWKPDMSPAEVARVVTFLCAEAPLAMTGSLVEMFG